MTKLNFQKEYSKEKLVFYIVLFALIITASIASLFQLWEQDIFWQIKAGHELFLNLKFQTREQWSYTAYGDPWFNFMWLSTAIIGLVHKFFGISGLIVSRSFILTSVLATILLIIKNITKKNNNSTAIILVSLSYSALVPRIQIRPEFFVIFLEAVLIYLWTTPKLARYQFIGSLILIVIATNLHPGVAPFLVMTSFAFGYQSLKNGTNRIWFSIFTIVAFFCTPYAKEIPEYLNRHLFYLSNTTLPNPEYFSLSKTDFDITRNSLNAWAWLCLTLLGLLGLIHNKYAQLPYCYQNRALTCTLFLCLALVSIRSPRAVPFQIIFSLPLIAVYLDELLLKNSNTIKYLLIIFSICWEITQIKFDPSPIGLKTYEVGLPSSTIAFIKKHHPKQNLLHIPQLGDYILSSIPEYKVFFDSREMPFDKIQNNIKLMFDSPLEMKRIIERYKISTVIFPTGFFLTPFDFFTSRREAFFPTRLWAVVGYDPNYFLLLKRIPEHEKLIRSYEYTHVIPDLPIDKLSRFAQADKVKVQFEIKRCQAENPDFAFCNDLQKLTSPLAFPNNRE